MPSIEELRHGEELAAPRGPYGDAFWRRRSWFDADHLDASHRKDRNLEQCAHGMHALACPGPRDI